MKIAAFLAAALSATTASAFGGQASAFVSSRVSSSKTSSTSLNVAAGDKIPAVELHMGFPPDFVNIAEYTAGRKVAVVGLPGAFTPVPGYLESQDALKEAGIDEVIVYCVNDGAVMKAWEADQGTAGSIVSMMGDPSGAFTKALDLEMTADGPKSVGIIGRCKRFAMVVDNSVVTAVAVAESELDPAGDDFPEKTLAPALIEMASAVEA